MNARTNKYIPKNRYNYPHWDENWEKTQETASVFINTFTLAHTMYMNLISPELGKPLSKTQALKILQEGHLNFTQEELDNPKRTFDQFERELSATAPIRISEEEIKKIIKTETAHMKECVSKNPDYLIMQFTQHFFKTITSSVKQPTAKDLFTKIQRLNDDYGLSWPTVLKYSTPEKSWQCLELVQLIKIANLDDLNKQDEKGFTPLHWAILFNNKPMTKALIKRGVDTEIQSKTGLTPLMIAVLIIHNHYNNRDSTRTLEYLLYVAKVSRKHLTEKDHEKIVECEKRNWIPLDKIMAEKQYLDKKEKQLDKQYIEQQITVENFINESIPLTTLDYSLKLPSTIVDAVMSTMVLDKDTSEEFRMIFAKLMRQALEKICQENPLIERILYFQARAALKEIPCNDNVVSVFVFNDSAMKILGQKISGTKGMFLANSNITVISYASEKDFINQANRYLENSLNIIDVDNLKPSSTIIHNKKSIDYFDSSTRHVLEIFTHEVLHNCLDRPFNNYSSMFAPEHTYEGLTNDSIISFLKQDFVTAKNYYQNNPEDKRAKWIYENVACVFPGSGNSDACFYKTEDIPAELPTHYIGALLSFANCDASIMNTMFPITTEKLFRTLDEIQRYYSMNFPHSCISLNFPDYLQSPTEAKFNLQFKKSSVVNTTKQEINTNNNNHSFFKSEEKKSQDKHSTTTQEKKKSTATTKKSSGLATGWFEQYSRECERDREKEKAKGNETRYNQK